MEILLDDTDKRNWEKQGIARNINSNSKLTIYGYVQWKRSIPISEAIY